MKRLPALDALRGIAILIVLVYHYVPEQYRSSLFWSGVDLFFVLSGFLITDILLKNVNSKNYYQTFYIRRAARILPLYWLLLLLFWLVMKIGGSGKSRSDVINLAAGYRKQSPTKAVFVTALTSSKMVIMLRVINNMGAKIVVNGRFWS